MSATTRRSFLGGVAALAGSAVAATLSGCAAVGKPPVARMPTKMFWPGGARLVVSISMQFEATAQGATAEGPFPPIAPGYSDTITPTWYRYGMNEGIPRLLALWDAHDIKVTSHMVGRAVELHPDLAREVVRRGHEASGHGHSWTPQYTMTEDEERASYRRSADLIERVTGQRPRGFNAFWMRHSPNTLALLQELGFLYHVDDLGRDEPSISMVRGRPFAVVPYTFRNNDIVRFGDLAMTPAAFLQNLRDELDVLYAEAGSRRRMMSISTHDRIAGAPAVVKALDDFLAYAKSRPGVVFLRKDEIARWAVTQPDVPHNMPT